MVRRSDRRPHAPPADGAVLLERTVWQPNVVWNDFMYNAAAVGSRSVLCTYEDGLVGRQGGFDRLETAAGEQ